ncbi:O-antigen ligase family protein [Mucilaginibacter xinganensis]|uniref:O-antigen ligase-related domain-containing protein n=1 Tax=Mucilaginibacter xinganensis TaxID=1234841 RepID=A0A223NUU4_9SPHI|nr:O-antigen ligase family protein [Mucilaginibacter xinganensis]ASU33652.1 hypothetical protein MuYL_1756 [Mucilaginibacter xinganensis]
MKSKLIYFIFFITLYELALMGSGQMLKAGPLTLRMFLFISIVSVSVVVVLLSKKIEKYFLVLTLLYSVVLSVGILVAVINHNPLSMVMEDLKPLIYFFSILFFSLMIKDAVAINMVSRVMRNSAIILAVGYLCFLAGLAAGLINFDVVYGLLDSTGEFFFRGTSGFFYKGFLYMCTGVFFFINKFSVRNTFILVLLVTAIVLTFTRGFLLSLVLVVIIYLLIFYKQKIVSFVIVISGAVLGYLYFGVYADVLGDKSDSDNIRVMEIAQVKSAIDPFSFFVGHGFGNGVDVRPDHMEISYLEIFHKQGVIGLFFWIFILGAIFFSYNKARHNGNKEAALPYLLASVFVFLQSFTNPYLNNPIGMSVVIIAIVALRRLEIIKIGVAR